MSDAQAEEIAALRRELAEVRNTAFGEIEALHRDLASAQDLATVATKAAISALAALEQVLKEMRSPRPKSAIRGLLDQFEPLDVAEDHVKRGLEVLRMAFEDSPHGP